MTQALHAVAQWVATGMVDSLVWGTVFAAISALGLRIARQSAGTRFVAWFATLLSIGMLPLISGRWSASSSGAASRSMVTVPERWAFWMLATWVVLAAWFLLSVGRSLWQLHLLRKNCIPLDLAELDPLLQETLLRQAASRDVALCTSHKIRVPSVVGLFKPVIAIPSWATHELSAAELNQILLHELAHLRRWDDWTNLAQKVTRAILFFHPAVWWVEKNITLEREMACDDAVLAVTASPRAYAECLAHLAEKSFLQRSVALVQAAIGGLRHTSLRLAKILDANRGKHPGRGWRPALALVAIVVVVAGVLSSRAPRLIAFEHHVATRATGLTSATNPVAAAPALRAVTSGAEASATVYATPARLRIFSDRRSSVRPTRSASTRLATRSSRTAEMVHLTDAKPVLVPVSETVFVMIEESPSSDVRVFQIQMFRITILHEALDPARVNTPRKET